MESARAIGLLFAQLSRGEGRGHRGSDVRNGVSIATCKSDRGEGDVAEWDEK
jgi:hypothetical protein